MTSLDLISQVKQSIAQLTDPNSLPSDLDLSNCDREPIHIPSAIQSHGVLLTFAVTDLTILQVSQNCQVFLGKKPTNYWDSRYHYWWIKPSLRRSRVA